MALARDYLTQNAHVLQPMSDHYPKQIKGDLRVILQTKDVFLQIKVMLDEYRKLNYDPSDIMSKEFLECQIQQGYTELSQLKRELKSLKRRLLRKASENDELCANLVVLGYPNVQASLSPRRNLLCRSPILKTKAKYRRERNEESSSDDDNDTLDLSLQRLLNMCREIESKSKSIIDLYHDVLTIHMHFMLVVTQFCTYAMPLVTEGCGLMDRMFFWSYRPELEMVRHNTELSDRLKDIYTTAQYFLTLITEMVADLRDKLKLLRELEVKFRESLNQQQHRRDNLLRHVHSIRHDIDVMNEENDRLVGLIVKSDPSFIHSRQFHAVANQSALHRQKTHESGTTSFTTSAGGPEGAKIKKKNYGSSSRNQQQPQQKNQKQNRLNSARNKNQSGSVLGEVTISAGSTDSLKNNLIQRTRSMFEAAMGRMDRSQGEDSRIDGCVLAEVSEVSEDREIGRQGSVGLVRRRGGGGGGSETDIGGPSWRNNSNDTRRPHSSEEVTRGAAERKKKKKMEKKKKEKKKKEETLESPEESVGYVVRL